ncbi:hypothetical protein BN1013_01657 [Candidatus Rubidus massiliensis]|nr:hypothetical protein BN1013_01657 [Candidatus Rubidus massiliensis]
MTIQEAHHNLNKADNIFLKIATAVPLIGEVTMLSLTCCSTLGRVAELVQEIKENGRIAPNEKLNLENRHIRVLRDYAISQTVRYVVSIAILATLVATGIILLNKLVIIGLVGFSIALSINLTAAVYNHYKSNMAVNYQAV